MSDLIRAPWTSEQVQALNDFQQRGGMHPFTCGRDTPGQRSPVLEATHGGWICPDPMCDYEQDWAHAFMADPTKWPKPWPRTGKPADEPARTTPNTPATVYAARSRTLAEAIGRTLARHGYQIPNPVLHSAADSVIRADTTAAHRIQALAEEYPVAIPTHLVDEALDPAANHATDEQP